MNRLDDNLENVLGEAPEPPAELWTRVLEGAFTAPIADVTALLPETDSLVPDEFVPVVDLSSTDLDADHHPTMNWAPGFDDSGSPDSLDSSDDAGFDDAGV